MRSKKGKEWEKAHTGDLRDFQEYDDYNEASEYGIDFGDGGKEYRKSLGFGDNERSGNSSGRDYDKPSSDTLGNSERSGNSAVHDYDTSSSSLLDELGVGRSKGKRTKRAGRVGTNSQTLPAPFLAFTKGWSILYIALFAIFLVMLVASDLLPILTLLLIIGALCLVSLFVFPQLYFRNIKRNRRLIALVLATILMCVYAYASLGLASVSGFFSTVTGGSGKYAKPVNVTRKPFNVYISGLDTSGSIKKKSRSDVNMIMTVNPKTQKIVLTSIPRDTVIRLKNKGDATDKLTHTGIYGIGTTLSSVEDLTGLDMNYYVKVNYSTVKRFVDAIGGIDVDSDYEFDTHGMKAKFHFVKGKNHLDGEHALAFARERKSFPDGDIQRNKNQAKVMQAMLKKGASSKTILMRYSSILNSCKHYMRINMAERDIKRLVKMQIARGYKWKIKKQAITGQPASIQCYSTGSYYVSVIEPDQSSLEKCVRRINKVMGKE